MSSLAECSNLGHQHPRVVAAIREQAQNAVLRHQRLGRRAARASWPSGCSRCPASAAAACSSRSAAPTPTRTRSRSRGRRRGRPRGIVIARDRSYHGASYRAMALSGDCTHACTRSTRTRSAFSHVAAAVRLPLPVRQHDATRNAAHRAAAARRRAHRSLRSRERRGGDDGAERRHERHRRPRQLLAGAARAHGSARRLR